MVADDPLVSIMSRMTLAVGMDSGWYEIDLQNSEKFDWGREKGCQMFDFTHHQENEEESAEELCDVLEKISCSSNGRFINKCQKNEFSGENYLNMPYKFCHQSKIDNKFSQSNLQNKSGCLKMKVGFARSCRISR